MSDPTREAAWDALREAVRMAGVLRTESVTIQAPLARTILTLLDGMAPSMELAALSTTPAPLDVAGGPHNPDNTDCRCLRCWNDAHDGSTP